MALPAALRHQHGGGRRQRRGRADAAEGSEPQPRDSQGAAHEVARASCRATPTVVRRRRPRRRRGDERDRRRSPDRRCRPCMQLSSNGQMRSTSQNTGRALGRLANGPPATSGRTAPCGRTLTRRADGYLWSDASSGRTRAVGQRLPLVERLPVVGLGGTASVDVEDPGQPEPEEESTPSRPYPATDARLRRRTMPRRLRVATIASTRRPVRGRRGARAARAAGQPPGGHARLGKEVARAVRVPGDGRREPGGGRGPAGSATLADVVILDGSLAPHDATPAWPRCASCRRVHAARACRLRERQGRARAARAGQHRRRLRRPLEWQALSQRAAAAGRGLSHGARAAADPLGAASGCGLRSRAPGHGEPALAARPADGAAASARRSSRCSSARCAAAPRTGSRWRCLYLDLDRFKLINGTYGRAGRQPGAGAGGRAPARAPAHARLLAPRRRAGMATAAVARVGGRRLRHDGQPRRRARGR